MNRALLQKVSEDLVGESLDISSFSGDVHRAVGGESKAHYAIKTYSEERADCLRAEAEGLETLRELTGFRIPKVIGQHAELLVLEWLSVAPAAHDDRLFGRRLAEMHSIEGKGFGYSRTTYCGPTPQENKWRATGGAFYWESRVGVLARTLSRGSAPIPNLMKGVERAREAFFLEWGDAEESSLIHGDLWQGNVLFLGDDVGVIDPALSYGPAEMDLAMLHLFGDPGSAFYHGYNEVRSLRPGYEKRIAFYQLYPLLNHALLFGKPYYQKVSEIICSL